MIQALLLVLLKRYSPLNRKFSVALYKIHELVVPILLIRHGLIMNGFVLEIGSGIELRRPVSLAVYSSRTRYSGSRSGY